MVRFIPDRGHVVEVQNTVNLKLLAIGILSWIGALACGFVGSLACLKAYYPGNAWRNYFYGFVLIMHDMFLCIIVKLLIIKRNTWTSYDFSCRILKSDIWITCKFLCKFLTNNIFQNCIIHLGFECNFGGFFGWTLTIFCTTFAGLWLAIKPTQDETTPLWGMLNFITLSLDDFMHF